MKKSKSEIDKNPYFKFDGKKWKPFKPTKKEKIALQKLIPEIHKERFIND